MVRKMKLPVSHQQLDQTERRNLSRRDAMTAIARFSAYVAPTTYILLDSKSAFAQACSGPGNGNGNGGGNGNGNGGGNGNGNGGGNGGGNGNGNGNGC